MQDTRTDNTLLDIITCMRKHILGMLIVFVCIVLVATTIILMQTPIYEAGSRILVKYGREYIYRPVGQLNNKGDIAPLHTYNSKLIINTELEIFRSTDLAEEVITSLGVEKLFPNLVLNAQDNASIVPIAVNRFAAMLDVFHVKESNVIGVAFQHQDPHIAVQAVSHLIERFKERHLQIFKNPQTSFLQEQVDLYREQLEDSENALKIFKQENHIYSLELNEQQKTFIEQYAKLRNLVIIDTANTEGLAEKKTALESQLEELPEVTENSKDSVRGSKAETVGYKLLDLKLRENNLRHKYKEDNRELKEVREQIALAETFLANQEALWRESTRTGKNQLFVNIKNELLSVTSNLMAHEKKNNGLQRHLNQINDQLQEMIPLEIDFKRLNRQVEAAEKTYSMFLSKFEESRIQDAMDSQKMINVVVIEKPRAPLRPVKPRKQLSLLVGIILGAACSFLYALFVEYAMARKI